MQCNAADGYYARAPRDGDAYVVSDRKIWTSTAQVANKILLLTRTTPIEQADKPTRGLALTWHLAPNIA